LGNGSAASSNVPSAVTTSGVLSGKTVTKLAKSKGLHNCVIASDSKAYCWGYNYSGYLGNNSTTTSLVPVAVYTAGVLSGKTVTDIAAGGDMSCAIASGAPYCWGYGAYGNLGNGSSTDSSIPVAVTTSGVLSGKTITAIAAGDDHACVLADGAPYCWGNNNFGQLGNNTTTNSNVPVATNVSGVLAGKTITSIALGTRHTCVIASGSAYCWGYNGNGQLGNNSLTASSVPVQVTNP
jgi:alpha-tubulin suppressor-like RCC1 family protein